MVLWEDQLPARPARMTLASSRRQQREGALALAFALATLTESIWLGHLLSLMREARR